MKDIQTIYGNKVRVRACGIAVHKNSLLLVRHEGLGERGQLWSFPGGGVEFGESLEEALVREFQEETGLEVEVGSQKFVYEYIQPPLHAIEIYFEVRATGGKIRTGTDPEVPEEAQHLQETKFVTFEELRVMNDEYKHHILRQTESLEALLNLSGYFKF